MSRIIEQPAVVVTGPDGTPLVVNGAEILHIQKRFRRWIGALEGKPKKEIWKVETTRALLELHNVMGTTIWTIARQAD